FEWRRFVVRRIVPQTRSYRNSQIPLQPYHACRNPPPAASWLSERLLLSPVLVLLLLFPCISCCNNHFPLDAGFRIRSSQNGQRSSPSRYNYRTHKAFQHRKHTLSSLVVHRR